MAKIALINRDPGTNYGWIHSIHDTATAAITESLRLRTAPQALRSDSWNEQHAHALGEVDESRAVGDRVRVIAPNLTPAEHALHRGHAEVAS